jgi:hypothetical protein
VASLQSDRGNVTVDCLCSVEPVCHRNRGMCAHHSLACRRPISTTSPTL